jgi:DnaJ-class molecular chaperone
MPDRSAATALERLRRMTPEQLDAARICRRCWEHYGVCVCGERRVRANPVCPNCHGTGLTRFGVCTYCNGVTAKSKAKSEQEDLQPPQDPGWRYAGRKYRTHKR